MEDSSSNAGFGFVPAERAVAERDAVRERLAARRAATQAQIEALDRDFKTIIEANALVAVDDEHDPEGQTTAFERQHVAALLARARDDLEKSDQALERLEQGDYGRCEVCGIQIPAERLEIRPATTMCVHCAAAPRRR
ncbi:TraR/DksA C4-type zinc finger protein [Streptomyces sp. NBC_00820]|uniref:TraR/DksA family transcriptional regulator n=1 Tax=Streptomyces sp. NBC_00820 TaxID=2975842 RepID=UPI002ED0E921|nr:TraR/DksA C4-type zinc finger protein [Streptomyces sp. NBC_00820]